MMPKDLVVFLEQDSRGNGARLGFAAGLARQWQAHLVATFVTRPLTLEPHADFAVGPALVSMLEGHSSRKALALEQARKEFDALTTQRSFTSEWRVADNEPPDVLMLHARHADIAILGASARQQRSTSVLGLSESMMFASGRPCILLPDDWPSERGVRRIVLGWNGGREATRAVADALPFLVAADAVHLVVVPDAATRGHRGGEPGADMATHLARHGVSVELEQHAGADAGAVLLARCKALDADMLVMGAKGRSDLGELIFGGATRTVMGASRVPVFVSG